MGPTIAKRNVIFLFYQCPDPAEESNIGLLARVGSNEGQSLIREAFEGTCTAKKQDPDQILRDLIGAEADVAKFWTDVKTNLQAGRIRMLFVADIIPDELRRVVEFLNAQMDPAEVLAIEIKQFAGTGLKTLVPRVIGQTLEAEDRKRATSGRERRQWDEASFFQELESRKNPEVVRNARRLLDWAKETTTEVWWGQGRTNGSFVPGVVIDNVRHYAFAVYTGAPNSAAVVEMYFQWWATKPPFDRLELRQEMQRRLNDIPGVRISAIALDKRPSIPLALLTPPEAMDKFLSAMNWWAVEVRKGTASAP